MDIEHKVEFLGCTPVRVLATNCGVVTVNVRFIFGRPEDLRRAADLIEQQEKIKIEVAQ